MIVLITLLGLFTLLFLYLYKKANVWKKQGVKGPRPLPFFGNSIDNLRWPLHIVETNRYKTFGRIYGFYEFTKPYLAVGEPELIKQIAVKDFHLFRNHIPLLPGDPIFSKALGFLEDEEWKRVRSLLSPAFTNNKIKRMFPFMDECVKNTLEHLQKLEKAGDEIDLKQICSAHSIDTITRCAFGLQTNGHKNPNDEILVHANQFTTFPLWRVMLSKFLPTKLQKALGVQLIPESVLAYFGNVIDHIAERRRKNKGVYDDFLQVMINAESSEITDGSNINNFSDGNKAKRIIKKLTKEEIIAQFPEFLIGGYEPAATILMYAMYALAVHPNYQERLFNEARETFKHKEVNYDDLNSMIFLDAFLNETFRLYGPFINTDRIASKDYELADTGIVIPKQTVVILPLFAIHHDPKFHPEPYEFKPERFLPENRDKMLPYTFMPFGVGPRICVAMNFAIVEIKLCLTKIILNFKFKSTAKTDIPPKHHSRKYFYHCDPLYVAIERRVK